MIIVTSLPYSKSQIKKLQEQFDIYIKTVIDINQKICVAGMDRHYEGEQLLLKNGSRQSDLWGGGVDIHSLVIDYNSFINIRPNDNNPSNEIQSQDIRKLYEQLTKQFFTNIYDH